MPRMLQIASYTSGKSEKFEGGGLYWTTEMGTGEEERHPARRKNFKALLY